MNFPNDERKESRFLIATDLVARLRPDMDINELLLWSPNLFAFTSYMLSFTSSYQLVVSPPRGKKWTPKNSEIKKWLDPQNAQENIKTWLEHCVVEKWQLDHHLTAEYSRKLDDVIEKLKVELSGEKKTVSKVSQEAIAEYNKKDGNSWVNITQDLGEIWRNSLSNITNDDFKFIANVPKIRKSGGKASTNGENSSKAKRRQKKLLDLLLKYTPASLIACWADFYNFVVKENQNISELLCNHDERRQIKEDVWIATQQLLTMHAVADEACVGWGLYRSHSLGGNAQRIAEEQLLYKWGTLATMHNERCRVLPKRHNADVGITLRSLSNNLAFHRSPIDVVWRQASEENPLSKKMKRGDSIDSQRITILLLPYPLIIRSGDFAAFNPNIDFKRKKRPTLEGFNEKLHFFEYKPEKDVELNEIEDAIYKAQDEIKQPIDILVLPESSLHKVQVFVDEERRTFESMLCNIENPPSVYIAGVREFDKELVTFPRNMVYCKELIKNHTTKSYFRDDKNNSHKQSKHHRWKLDGQQIKQYGLSQVLSPTYQWWEGIKIPRRKVGFLNVGDRLTICPLVCEDLARQDPIADLIRQVGPSLVVTVLMDGPQKRDRWSSKYASVLSEDPGCAVITLTSFGMVRRWNSPFQQMSRVVALWSENGAPAREIELEQGSNGILLTLEVRTKHETTVDGRKEKYETSKISLIDVIQIYTKP